MEAGDREMNLLTVCQTWWSQEEERRVTVCLCALGEGRKGAATDADQIVM